jgi:putative spermidine/putrescine transport system permease protein
MVSTKSRLYTGSTFNWEHCPEWLQAYVLLLPAVSIIGLLFGGGLILAVLQSLGMIRVFPPAQLSLDAYRQALSHPELLSSILLTLTVAVITTVLSSLLSIALALLLRTASRWATIACQITLPIPHLVGVAGVWLLLAPSGFLSRILIAFGWIQSDQDMPLLINDLHYIGLFIHFLWKEIPFITLILLAVLRGINPSYEHQARALGATPWKCFWTITLPMMKTGILSASLFVFSYVFAAFEVPFLLGPTRPRTLPILIYREFTDTDIGKRPQAVVLGLILSLISMVILAAYLSVTNRKHSTSSNQSSC